VGLLLLGVDEGMLESGRIFRWRLHYCIDNNGGRFEHFL
jgi:hypothetical protein